MNAQRAQYRIPARMATAVGAYLVYRWAVDDRVLPAVFLGVGTLLIAWAAVDEMTLPKRDRPSLLTIGPALLGMGLLGLGLYLTLR